jgi:hypothetical protein
MVGTGRTSRSPTDCAACFGHKTAPAMASHLEQCSALSDSIGDLGKGRVRTEREAVHLLGLALRGAGNHVVTERAAVRKASLLFRVSARRCGFRRSTQHLCQRL